MPVQRPRQEQNSQPELESIALASISEYLERLETRLEGLTSEEAGRRLRTYGPNATAGDEWSALSILLGQFQNGLIVNQSALTGESMWQEKDPAPLAAAAPSLEATKNFLFSGTSVMAGTGKGVVVNTGNHTAFGRTASLLRDIRRSSDFQRNLDQFSGFLLRFGIGLTILIFLLNAWLGRDFLTSLTLSLALALGLVPEALPAVTITALSLGAAVLARKKVVVRRLASVKDFSAIDVLCTDKTGKITHNKIAVTGFI